MDALAVLRQEIARKKQEAQETKALVGASAHSGNTAANTTSTDNGAGPVKKYLRKGDVEALLTGQAHAASSAASELRGGERTGGERGGEERTGEERRGDERTGGERRGDERTGGERRGDERTGGERRGAALPLPESFRSLPKSEVIRRLRRHGQVVTYFGEDDLKRVIRLWEYVNSHVLEKEDMAVKGGFEVYVKPGDAKLGIGHLVPSLASVAAAVEEPDALPPAAKRKRVDGVESTEDLDVPVLAAGTKLDDDARSKGSKEKARTLSTDAAKYRGKDDHKFIYKYFKGLLNEWEDEVVSKPLAQKSSAAGKQELLLLKQSNDFMRPFFRMCKQKSLSDDVRKLCKEVVEHCLDREYTKAGDAYVRMAIGNAAWPIGVTAVGLHERAAREKVAEGKQAHVMHDEESRKYVTIIKRLMAKAQERYPTDPSKSLYS